MLPGIHRSRFGTSRLFLILGTALLFFAAHSLRAAEVIPPVPPAYFNDYAGVVRPEVARRLNRELEAFEQATSNQIVVAVYPKMESDSSIEDYTVRVAEAWKVGQKGRDNGAVLFVFVNDRKMYIQVGYGLEGALTDFQVSQQIVEREMKPRFRTGDYTGGLEAGVQAMIAATKGEYKGTGGTAAQGGEGEAPFWWNLLVALGLFLFFMKFGGGGPRGYTGRGPVSYGGWGRGGGRGGGGFSGGGGRFGGGGAGGSW